MGTVLRTPPAPRPELYRFSRLDFITAGLYVTVAAFFAVAGGLLVPLLLELPGWWAAAVIAGLGALPVWLAWSVRRHVRELEEVRGRHVPRERLLAEEPDRGVGQSRHRPGRLVPSPRAGLAA